MAIELEKLEKMPWYQKFLILVLVIAALGALFFYFLYSPVQKDLEKTKKSLEGNRTKLADLEKLKTAKDQIEKDIEKQATKLEGYMKFIPSDEKLTELLAAFSDFAVKSGVQITIIKPGKQRSEKDMYYEIPVELQFSGPYWNVISFFYSLTNPSFSRVVKFTNVSMVRVKGSINERPQISVKCIAVTYKIFEK